MRILARRYIGYKFFNSLFTGLTVGAVFTIYSALEPSVFSVGGIVLAVGMLFIARWYGRLLNLVRFFQISLFVEVVMILLVAAYLLHPYAYATAMTVYAGYQLTFMFGSYLVRAETLFLKRRQLLSWVDMAKQAGYLGGLLVSWGYYAFLERIFGIGENGAQVWWLHWVLLAGETVIIVLLLRSFRRS